MLLVGRVFGAVPPYSRQRACVSKKFAELCGMTLVRHCSLGCPIAVLILRMGDIQGFQDFDNQGCNRASRRGGQRTGRGQPSGGSSAQHTGSTVASTGQLPPAAVQQGEPLQARTPTAAPTAASATRRCWCGRWSATRCSLPPGPMGSAAPSAATSAASCDGCAAAADLAGRDTFFALAACASLVGHYSALV